VSAEAEPKHRAGPATRTALETMLEAESVAVVGASARPGSFGERILLELVEGGYEGRIYPVNPRYQEVLGLACHGSIAELPEPVDVAILGVPNAALEEQLAAAAAAGARSAVIFGGIRPSRVETRCTCVSTGKTGRAKRKSSSTAAVFRPMPGRRESSVARSSIADIDAYERRAANGERRTANSAASAIVRIIRSRAA